MTTINYYNTNATSFVAGTVSVDFSSVQNLFLDMLPKYAHILDFGCGSGRDTKYFLEQGYAVDATDGSLELCKAATEYTGISVKHQMFQELDVKNKYDGIWACASILHIKREELPEVLGRMNIALKENGVMYVSFKYGDFEGIRNGRHFTDMTEESLGKLLLEYPKLKIEKLWITGDVRKGREDERWLNVILKK